MEKIIRQCVLGAVLAFAIICIAHEPLNPMPMNEWLASVISSKVIGFIALAYFAMLNRKWKVYRNGEK